MVDPVKRVTIDAHLPLAYGDGVLIEWVIDESFPCNWGPLTHTVLVGNSPSDQFTKLDEVFDDTVYVDPVKRSLTTLLDTWYAIMTVDAKGKRYFSPPQKVASRWAKREWLIAREATRQAKVRLIKRKGGVRGFLLRRRVVGAPCSTCLDPDTQRITDPMCEECYGTGITGGYYPAVECYVDQHPEKLVFKIDPTLGIITDKLGARNILAYPPFHPNDVWVTATTGLRYLVQETVATIAHIEGVPLFQQIQVEAAELNTAIYKYPVPCT